MNVLVDNGYSGLGITATHRRIVKEGLNFDHLFPDPEGTDPIVNKNAEVHDTLKFVSKVVLNTLNDTKKIARILKRKTAPATMKSVFDFFYQHYQYKLDKFGVEQVRRPARAWADRKQGIDCDCFATSVSSILTNLGVEHFLKIIAINGKDYFQHIYVVVPKFKNADLKVRSNYWVIDPVLNRFDEEAPNITKTDYLKMNGIPLQYLNGVDDNNYAKMAGLGREFDGIETELSGLEDMEGLGYARFRAAMHNHVRNTMNKIASHPNSVEAVYKPHALLEGYRCLNEAFNGDDEHLMGVLEDLSAREEEMLQPQFQGLGSALHQHDDYLYGIMYGDTDDQMIGVVLGLAGKKGRSGGKIKAAVKKAKAGVFTKVKNAVKTAKAVTKKAATKTKAVAKKAAVVVKKIAKAVVKHNPVSIAARAGFLIAMRTNFGFIAEKAYWAYQTEAFAKSKGISSDYWKKSKQLLDRITKTFVGTLKGDASALKKAIVNGRAAKKTTKQLKKKGMTGLGALMGLGVVEAATISAAAAFITPILTFMKGLFKKDPNKKAAKTNTRKGKKGEGEIENENDTASDAPTDDVSEEINETAREASDPSDTTVDNDGSVEAADAANEEEPSSEGQNFNTAANGRGVDPGSERLSMPDAVKNSSKLTNEEKSLLVAAMRRNGITEDQVERMSMPEVAIIINKERQQQKTEAENSNEGEKKSNTPLIIGCIAAAALLAADALGGKKKNSTVNGLSGFNKKTESKKLKKNLKKKGVTLPHGYEVKKRKKVKSIKLQ